MTRATVPGPLAMSARSSRPRDRGRHEQFGPRPEQVRHEHREVDVLAHHDSGRAACVPDREDAPEREQRAVRLRRVRRRAGRGANSAQNRRAVLVRQRAQHRSQSGPAQPLEHRIGTAAARAGRSSPRRRRSVRRRAAVRRTTTASRPRRDGAARPSRPPLRDASARAAGCARARRSCPAPGTRASRPAAGRAAQRASSAAWPGTHCSVALLITTSTVGPGCSTARRRRASPTIPGDRGGPARSSPATSRCPRRPRSASAARAARSACRGRSRGRRRAAGRCAPIRASRSTNGRARSSAYRPYCSGSQSHPAQDISTSRDMMTEHDATRSTRSSRPGAANVPTSTSNRCRCCSRISRLAAVLDERRADAFVGHGLQGARVRRAVGAAPQRRAVRAHRRRAGHAHPRHVRDDDQPARPPRRARLRHPPSRPGRRTHRAGAADRRRTAARRRRVRRAAEHRAASCSPHSTPTPSARTRRRPAILACAQRGERKQFVTAPPPYRVTTAEGVAISDGHGQPRRRRCRPSPRFAVSCG